MLQSSSKFFPVLVLIGLHFFFPTIDLPYYHAVCFVLIILFGIPHGAADHKINAFLNRYTNVYLYIVKYLLIALGFALWWAFLPGKAFFIFLILSAYHFGQELLEDHQISSKNVLEVMVWGAMILFVPITLTYNELIISIEFVTKTELAPITVMNKVLVVMPIVVLSVLFMLKRYRNKELKRHRLLRLSYIIVITFINFSFLPFLVAFTYYFIFFHSFNALKHQFNWLKSKQHHYKLKSFIIDLVPFSALSVFGLVVFVLLINPQSWDELTGCFFVLISMITLPHSILFDQFYKEGFAEKTGYAQEVTR